MKYFSLLAISFFLILLAIPASTFANVDGDIDANSDERTIAQKNFNCSKSHDEIKALQKRLLEIRRGGKNSAELEREINESEARLTLLEGIQELSRSIGSFLSFSTPGGRATILESPDREWVRGGVSAYGKKIILDAALEEMAKDLKGPLIRNQKTLYPHLKSLCESEENSPRPNFCLPLLDPQIENPQNLETLVDNFQRAFIRAYAASKSENEIRPTIAGFQAKLDALTVLSEPREESMFRELQELENAMQSLSPEDFKACFFAGICEKEKEVGGIKLKLEALKQEIKSNLEKVSPEKQKLIARLGLEDRLSGTLEDFERVLEFLKRRDKVEERLQKKIENLWRVASLRRHLREGRDIPSLAPLLESEFSLESELQALAARLDCSETPLFNKREGEEKSFKVKIHQEGLLSCVKKAHESTEFASQLDSELTAERKKLLELKGKKEALIAAPQFAKNSRCLGALALYTIERCEKSGAQSKASTCYRSLSDIDKLAVFVGRTGQILGVIDKKYSPKKDANLLSEVSNHCDPIAGGPAEHSALYAGYQVLTPKRDSARSERIRRLRERPRDNLSTGAFMASMAQGVFQEGLGLGLALINEQYGPFGAANLAWQGEQAKLAIQQRHSLALTQEEYMSTFGLNFATQYNWDAHNFSLPLS